MATAPSRPGGFPPGREHGGAEQGSSQVQPPALRHDPVIPITPSPTRRDSVLHVIVHPRTFVRRLKAIAALSPGRGRARPILETVQLVVGEDGSATLRAANLDSFA